MTRKTIRIFIDEIFSKALKKNNATNKTDVYHIDDIWSLDNLGSKDYGPENNRGYGNILVVIEKFSKLGWCVPLKIKNAQTITNFFAKILISSTRKPDLIATDRDKGFYSNIFQIFVSNNNLDFFSTNSSFGVVYAERYNRTIRNILKRTVFLKKYGNWIVVLPTITKQYNNRVHTFTKLTPIQASLKKNERYVYGNLLDKRKKAKVSSERSRSICSIKGNFLKRRNNYLVI